MRYTNPYNYEDDYYDYDNEEQFQKIKKKNHKLEKDVKPKSQIKQQRKQKNKNREEIEKQEKYLTEQFFAEKKEDKGYEEYEDDWA